MSRRPRRWRRRLLLAVLLIVGLELALQLAAPLVQRAMGGRGGPPSPDAAFTVLCVGDSNTYGLHLPRAYAYPSQLQARLARRFEREVSVVNRGVPGHSAAQVAEHLPEDLRATDPDVVVALAGINDTWNTTGREGPLARLVGRLRLVRLARVLAAGVTTARPFEVRSRDGRLVVDRGDGGEPVAAAVEGTLGSLRGEALREVVTTQLERWRAACADRGVPLVLMTYPDPHLVFPTVNEALRAFAREHDLPLVEHDRAFEAHYAERGYETLMFPDHHPNLQGYALMVDGLVRTLAQAGLVPPTEHAGEPPPPRRVAVAPSLRADGEGTLALLGPPGWAYQVALSRERDERPAGLRIEGVTVPLHEDEILVRSRTEPGLSGALGPDGTARVEVPPALLAERPLRACLILLRPPDEARRAGSGVAAVSEPLVLAR